MSHNNLPHSDLKNCFGTENKTWTFFFFTMTMVNVEQVFIVVTERLRNVP